MANSVIKRVSVGEQIFRNLNGVFCVYKPPDMDLIEVLRKVKTTLLKGINDLPCRPIEKIVKIDEQTNKLYIGRNMSDSVEGDSRKFWRLMVFK